MIIALDIGASSCKWAHLDQANETVQSLAIIDHVRPQPGPEQLFESIARTAASFDISELRLCVPGLVDKGVLKFSRNLAWQNVDIAGALEEASGLAASLILSDAEAAGRCAQKEMAGVSDYVAFVLGTGLGGMAVKAGRVIQRTGLGHVEVTHGYACPCGLSQCLEARVGRAGVIESSRQRGLNIGNIKGLCQRGSAGSTAARAELLAIGEVLAAGFRAWQRSLELAPRAKLWLAGGASLAADIRHGVERALGPQRCVFSRHGRLAAAAGLLLS
jgi:glucokinase